MSNILRESFFYEMLEHNETGLIFITVTDGNSCSYETGDTKFRIELIAFIQHLLNIFLVNETICPRGTVVDVIHILLKCFLIVRGHFITVTCILQTNNKTLNWTLHVIKLSKARSIEILCVFFLILVKHNPIV